MQVLATLILYPFAFPRDRRLKLTSHDVRQPVVKILKGISQKWFHCWLSCSHLITLALSRNDLKGTLTPHESLVRVLVVLVVAAFIIRPVGHSWQNSLPLVLFFVTADNVSVVALFTFRCL